MCHFCIVLEVGDYKLNNNVCVPHTVVIPPVNIMDQIGEGTIVTRIIVLTKRMEKI